MSQPIIDIGAVVLFLEPAGAAPALIASLWDAGRVADLVVFRRDAHVAGSHPWTAIEVVKEIPLMVPDARGYSFAPLQHPERVEAEGAEIQSEPAPKKRKRRTYVTYPRKFNRGCDGHFRLDPEGRSKREIALQARMWRRAGLTYRAIAERFGCESPERGRHLVLRGEWMWTRLERAAARARLLYLDDLRREAMIRRRLLRKKTTCTTASTD